jgi:hypothetical protein
MVTHGYPHVICSFLRVHGPGLTLAQKNEMVVCYVATPKKIEKQMEIYSIMFGEYIFYTIQETLFYPCQDLQYRNWNGSVCFT